MMSARGFGREPSCSARACLGYAVVLGCALVRTGSAQDLTDVTADIVANIEQSQQRLNELESDIRTERAGLAERLTAARASVEALREQTVAARRLADEQTLGLDRLEQRVESLREQSRFQARLLSGLRFEADAGEAAQAGTDDDLGRDLEWLATYVSRSLQGLRPQWREQDVVMTDGRVQSAQSLRLGPVAWFWRPESGQGGLLDERGGLVRAGLTFSDASQVRALQGLYESGSGRVTLDPTLSRALLLAEEDETVLEHLRKGGIWVVPILLFALFASAIAIAKGISLWRLPPLVPALAARVEKALQDGKLETIRGELAGAQAELLDISVSATSAQQRDDKLFACLLEHKHGLERWLGAITVTAAVAPLLGLLGTVSGMITTFRLLTVFGAGDPSAVSGGISEALVTTELGLIVAIPALLAHAVMSRKVKAYFSQLESNAVELSQLQLPERAA